MISMISMIVPDFTTFGGGDHDNHANHAQKLYKGQK